MTVEGKRLTNAVFRHCSETHGISERKGLILEPFEPAENRPLLQLCRTLDDYGRRLAYFAEEGQSCLASRTPEQQHLRLRHDQVRSDQTSTYPQTLLQRRLNCRCVAPGEGIPGASVHEELSGHASTVDDVSTIWSPNPQ